MRARALTLFQTAIKAADPAAAVEAYLPAQLPQPDPGGRLVIIALGKAAPAMMSAVRRHILNELDWSGLVVTHTGIAGHDGPVETIIGDHPVPDSSSASGGAAILNAAAMLGEKDRLLTLISGGGSALAVAPIDGMSLSEKKALNTALLASGMAINQVNEVRQVCSRLKGGGLARAAYPAPVTSLILSDVIGDDLSAIASGPTAPPIGTPHSALTLLDAHQIAIPDTLRRILKNAHPATKLAEGDTILVGSNTQSLDAVAAHPLAEGLTRLGQPVIGDVGAAVTTLIRKTQNSFVGGGETTVILKGSGKGGRNQELALRFAMAAENKLKGNWVFLSGGTDGRDGPTDAAGAIVDASSVARMRKAGADPEALLANNDAYRALDASKDLIRMEATGTNVADIQIFLKGPP